MNQKESYQWTDDGCLMLMLACERASRDTSVLTPPFRGEDTSSQ